MVDLSQLSGVHRTYDYFAFGYELAIDITTRTCNGFYSDLF